MAHTPNDSTVLGEVLELLSECGFDGLAHALEILLNEAMIIERSEFLGAEPYERSDERRGLYRTRFRGQ